ncbi:MAG TPA: hypothetical protein VGD01_11550 [Candidatus Elarobacter sp.]|jgi:hypothetical protein
MASMPPITGIRLGISNAGSAGTIFGAGHESITLDFRDGTSMVLEAGPDGPMGTGNLVETNYGGSLVSQLAVATSNINATGLALLNSYDNFAANTADTPVAYSPDNSDGFNSNAFISALWESIGFSDEDIDRMTSDVESASHLSAVGSDTATARGLAPEMNPINGSPGTRQLY